MSLGKPFIILVALFVIGAGILVFQATRSTSSHILVPHELVNEKQTLRRVRLGGKVSESAPINYEMTPHFLLTFSVEDPGTSSSVQIPVRYEGIKPDMFAPGRAVLLDGSFENGIFLASSLQTQCPSKYEPPSPEK